MHALAHSTRGFVAVVRRAPGGLGLKTAKSGPDLFLQDTKPSNLGTYLKTWPRHLTQYLCYGSSLRTECRQLGQSLLPSRRAYIALAEKTVEDPTGGLEARDTCARTDRPPERRKAGISQLRAMYARGEPLSMLTAYDYMTARVADKAGVDMVLVGDSLGMVVLGQEDTTEVTVRQMVHHCQAAARGVRSAFLVADMPFGSYVTPHDAARNGVSLLKDGRADAVKLEGGRRVLPQVHALVDAGVAVMGHLGLTPQSHAQLGGYRVQAKTALEAHELLEEALALQAAGCFMIVLECVPAAVAAEITSRLSVPTIGIGAGGGTSGQVQVWHDVLGLYDRKQPRFSRQFASLEAPIAGALSAYCSAVKRGAFPAARHQFPMAAEEFTALRQMLGAGAGAERAEGRAEERAEVHSAGTKAVGAKAVGAKAVGGRAAPVVVRTVAQWRALQAEAGLCTTSVGLVPTMGALHEGHVSLVKQARSQTEVVVASLFVNPTQFAAGEDLDQYPRTWEEDLRALSEAGVDYLFAPNAEEMYPPSALAPSVILHGIEAAAEANRRPGHFEGVATVVTKLINIVQPSAVFFGQKDGMQCVVVRRLVDGLHLNTRIVVGETSRAADGLALSSRNRYLSPTERTVAPLVYQALVVLRDAHLAGEVCCEALRTLAQGVIATEPLLSLEYVSIASTDDGAEMATLPPLGQEGGAAFASIAVRCGTTRLIDNLVLGL